MPKKVKYKKRQKGNLKVKHKTAFVIKEKSRISARLIALQSCMLTEKQLKSAKTTITKRLTRGDYRQNTTIFLDTPITKKPSETRMGKGKGNFSVWCSKVSKGSCIFEVSGGRLKKCQNALKSASKKLPIKTLTQTVIHNNNVKAGKG